MKHLATSILFLGLCLMVNAQAPLVKQWDKRYGGVGNDELSCLQQTIDGEYILGGTSFSDSTGDRTEPNWNNEEDYWIVKINSSGIKQWDKRFGGTFRDRLTSLQQTTDKGYILGGSSASQIGGNKTQPTWGPYYDYWIVKIDSLGNKQWDRNFGGTNTDELAALQQTTDGGYILGGASYSGIGGDKTQPNWNTSTYSSDFWIMKTDTGGNLQWEKRFGGTGSDVLDEVEQTSDGGYILGGTSLSGIGGDKTQSLWGGSNDMDYWIVKINSLGIKQWDKRFGGTLRDALYALRQTSDGGYILGGLSKSGISGDKTQPRWGGTNDCDYWIVKIDSLGIKQWDKRFGGTGNQDEFGSIVQTTDRGYLLVGMSYSAASGDKSENNLGFEQTWIVKIDSLGNKQWDKTIFTNGHDEYAYGLESIDGCYVIANAACSPIGGYKTQLGWDAYPSGVFDYWVVKFCDSAHSQCNLSSATLTANQTIFCSGDSAQVCAPSGFTYLWNTGQNTACINAQLAGNYYVTVTDNNGCTAESNHLAITVLPLPPVAISVNGDTLSVYGAVTQQWYLNGSAISNATSNIYIATQGGSYTVAVTDSNGCIATSSAVIISGIDNLSEHDVVSVYPNPLDFGFWILECGSNLIGSKYEILDADGRVVFQSKITNPKSKIELNVSKGVYLLRISSSKSSVVRKLIRL